MTEPIVVGGRYRLAELLGRGGMVTKLRAARLAGIPGLTIVGTAPDKAAVLSFTLGRVHPHDLGTILDSDGVAIRAGHHCAQPVMERFGVHATARASFAFYNTLDEIDVLVQGLHRAREVFA